MLTLRKLPLAVATLAVTVVGTLVSCPAASAQQTVRVGASLPGKMGVPQPEPMINLSVKNRSLARVLFEVFKQTPYQYKLESELGTTQYSVDARGIPLTEVLKQIQDQDKGTEPLVWSYTRTPSGGLFIISREFFFVGNKDGEARVSLSNARITKVLPPLFDLMKVKGRVEPDVPPVTLSLELRPTDWVNVLPQLLLEVYKKEPAVTYSMDGDTYVVHLQRTPTGIGNLAQAAAARKVKMDVKDATLQEALQKLFEGSKWKYQIADKVGEPRVSYVASSEPELAALNSILRQAGINSGKQITYREGKGVIYIEPGPLAGDFQVGRTAGVRTTSLDVKMLALSKVAALLEGALGIPIKVADNVPDLPIDFRAIDAPAELAMRLLRDAAKAKIPNIDYRTRGTGYLIELAK